MSKKFIGIINVRLNIDDSEMYDKICNFLKKNYKNYEELDGMIGGGVVDYIFRFNTIFNSKKDVDKYLEPFMEKFDLLDPDIEYGSAAKLIAEKKFEADEKKRIELLKLDIMESYNELCKKHAKNSRNLEDLKELFCDKGAQYLQINLSKKLF